MLVAQARGTPGPPGAAQRRGARPSHAPGPPGLRRFGLFVPHWQWQAPSPATGSLRFKSRLILSDAERHPQAASEHCDSLPECSASTRKPGLSLSLGGASGSLRKPRRGAPGLGPGSRSGSWLRVGAPGYWPTGSLQPRQAPWTAGRVPRWVRRAQAPWPVRSFQTPGRRQWPQAERESPSPGLLKDGAGSTASGRLLSDSTVGSESVVAWALPLPLVSSDRTAGASSRPR
jgi:hypothetical protein